MTNGIGFYKYFILLQYINISLKPKRHKIQIEKPKLW